MIETTTHPTGAQDPRILEPPPAEDGRATSQWESASKGGLRSTGIDGEPALRIDGRSEDGLPIRVGDRDEGMGVSPGRGRQPELSFDPGSLDPHQPLPAISV
jgi:hypothetical protein